MSNLVYSELVLASYAWPNLAVNVNKCLLRFLLRTRSSPYKNIKYPRSP
jgi:hypothetical protein